MLRLIVIVSWFFNSHGATAKNIWKCFCFFIESLANSWTLQMNILFALLSEIFNLLPGLWVDENGCFCYLFIFGQMFEDDSKICNRRKHVSRSWFCLPNQLRVWSLTFSRKSLRNWNLSTHACFFFAMKRHWLSNQDVKGTIKMQEPWRTILLNGKNARRAIWVTSPWDFYTPCFNGLGIEPQNREGLK